MQRIYQIFISRTAEKALKQVPARDQKRVVSAIQGLSVQPFPVGSKKLTGEESTFRIRVGDYRIIYDVEGKTLVILVLKLGHRKDIYR